MVTKKTKKLKEKGVLKRFSPISQARYEKAIKETEDEDVLKRLSQMREATKGKEVRETASRLATPAYRRGLPSGTKKLDNKISSIARKAINLAAPKGFIKEMTRPAGKGSGRGRGRPKKSYKLRFVPGYGAVRVPTAIYNKMMSEVKAKRRLAEAQRQANIQQQYEAESIAMQQDPRFQQQQDSFLDGPDLDHEQEVAQVRQREILNAQIQQQQMRQPQGNVVQRAGGVIRRFGAGVNRLGQSRSPQQYPQQYSPQYAQQFQTGGPMEQSRGDPRVTAISSRSNILNQPNIFNRPENVAVGFKRRV